MGYSFNNFYRGTVANFTSCSIPSGSPDFVSDAGSAYWDLGEKVIRWSDHWGVCGSCFWQLWGGEIGLCGECNYSDFREI